MNEKLAIAAHNNSLAFVWRHALQTRVPSLVVVLAAVSHSLGSLYGTAVHRPLRRLYRTGPHWGGVGFWRNASNDDVCAALSKVEAKFWHSHPDRCARLIEEDFQSYLVVLETLVYFAFLYGFVVQAWRLLCFATQKSLQKNGFVDRYSPRTLAWLRTRFPSTQRHYVTAQTKSDLRQQRIDTGAKEDSPYSVYGTE